MTHFANINIMAKIEVPQGTTEKELDKIAADWKKRIRATPVGKKAVMLTHATRRHAE